MFETILKALGLISTIGLGHLLVRLHILNCDDAQILSKIILKITLPAVVILNFSRISLQPAMLITAFVGFIQALLFLSGGFLLGEDRNGIAFSMTVLGGSNIGNFALPFATVFLGTEGSMLSSIYDIGNGLIALGGGYSLAFAVKNGKGTSSLKTISTTLIRSTPLITAFIMIAVSFLRIQIPESFLSVVSIPAGANTFLAMLMLGISFQFPKNSDQWCRIAKILLVRYAVSISLSLIWIFVIPAPSGYRNALLILSLAPMTTCSIPYVMLLNEDYNLASAVNSMSVIISTVLIFLLLPLTQ